MPTLSVQHLGNVQMLVSYVKSKIEVVEIISLERNNGRKAQMNQWDVARCNKLSPLISFTQ